MIISLEGITLEKSLRLSFLATNNEVEYEALQVGLVVIQKIGGKFVKVYCDSRLIVEQVQGEFEAKDSRMLWYLNQVKRLLGNFHSLALEQVPQSKKSHVDSLATLATLIGERLPRIILVENLVTPAYDKQTLVGVHFRWVGPSWMDPIVSFLKDGTLPKDKTKAEKTQRKAPRYQFSEEQKLYKCLYLRPYLMCIHPEVVEALLEELYEGICGNHTRGRSLAYTALT